MTRKIFSSLVGALSLSLLIALGTTGCTNPAHCPGVASTGNYKPGNSARKNYKGKSSKRCPGTASTGNFKPKSKKNKPQDGLYSKEMKKAMKKNKTEPSGSEVQAQNE